MAIKECMHCIPSIVTVISKFKASYVRSFHLIILIGLLLDLMWVSGDLKSSHFLNVHAIDMHLLFKRSFKLNV